MRVKLTDRFVKSATTEGRKSPIFMDDEVIRFGVQVRETGRKSFTLDCYFEGRRRRLYIGDFPDWSTNAGGEHTVGPMSICCNAWVSLWPISSVAATQQFGRYRGNCGHGKFTSARHKLF